ncbi:lytic transglycosylase domain-containing protein [Helicobacter mustelae]|uniref:Putative secreted transglycosylase n=1 Tax=Helicobacter mustelae (strain ATCC 43772 / CCUG 25715 / CIP 103759 / LMG 18044 / NCTC 12198 / R85-136P) TaxID=679897 RepID=D3UGK4_HELM1|nr:lytic transglycosylase domain-containing protein [Helicobacter mustelae]CBG39625.1 putative secreted transglycosylase [Helicobacter mustelae 12198]SQH71136.1 secreted transglycosylase [Helicobacter mustelae]
MKKWSLLFCFCGCIFAKEITIDFLQKQPQGVARDFYIWYFISRDKTSIDEAKVAYDLVFKKTPRIEKAMEKKGIIHEMPRDIYCKKLDFDALKKEDADCIAYGIKLSLIPTLPQADVDILLNALKEGHENLYDQILVLRSPSILNALLSTTPKNFAQIFHGLSYVQKLALFNQGDFDTQALKKLLDANFSGVNRAITKMILDPKFHGIKNALSEIEVGQSDANTFFLLGMNELLLQKPKRALAYFAKSQNVAIDPFMRDRALFWQYLLSEDQSFLQQVAQSTFVDIFSIYANKKLQTTPKYQIISDFEISGEMPKFDIKNPFVWQQKKTEISGLSGQKYEDALEQFHYKESLPHLVFFLNRKHRYNHNYFIFAYDDPKLWRSPLQKALVYAVARQESHLLPALISSSYALGMMQIMPFNVEPFAKDLKLRDITLFDMFEPRIALRFGAFYLDQLEKEFKHPLFIAYAYNGGPGFLRRTLARNHLFLKDRKYEPWISMELLPYDESRFYGMRVIANYLIYAQMLGKDIDVEDFLKQTIKFQKGKQ